MPHQFHMLLLQCPLPIYNSTYFTPPHIQFNIIWLSVLKYAHPYLVHSSYGNIMFDLCFFDL
jgi:hypothetical protein